MRLPREIVPHLPHHFILRGNNRRRLFSYPWEYRLFLRLLADAAELRKCAVHALTLMTNHVHVVATPPSAHAASAFVQSFAQRYAQRRNLRRGGTGKLFEQRYVSVPVKSERQLAIVTSYVEMNPVRAGLCADPAGWPWTTYGYHVGRFELSAVPARLWTPSPWYLRLDDAIEQRWAHYADWMAECQARDLRPEAVELSIGETEIRVRRPNQTRAT